MTGKKSWPFPIGINLYCFNLNSSMTTTGYSLPYLKQTADNGYILAGETFETGTSKGYLVKLDSTGTVEWKKTFGGNRGTNIFEDIIITSGGFLMVGETTSFGNGRQAYAVKTSATGSLIWQNSYGNPGIDFAKSVVELSNGDFVLTGGTNSTPFPDIDNWAFKINASGAFQQDHIVADYSNSFPYDQNDDWSESVFLHNDTLVFAGKRSFESAEPGNIYIYRFSNTLGAGGYHSDYQKFISPDKETAYDSKRTFDNGVIFACSAEFMDTSESNIYLIKMDSTMTYPHPYFNSISKQNDYTTISEKESLLKSERKNIQKLNTELSKTKLDLEAALKKENSISLLGAQLNKTTYNLILWFIIIALSLALSFFVFKFSRSNILTNKAQDSLQDVELEFENHRKKAIEREQKLRRQLQDEINKHRN